MIAEGHQDNSMPRMTAVVYDEKELGPMDYSHLMYFLFAVNNQYRQTLPGNNMAHNPDIVDMLDVYEIERLRFKISHKEDIDLRKEMKQYKKYLRSMRSKDEL